VAISPLGHRSALAHSPPETGADREVERDPAAVSVAGAFERATDEGEYRTRRTLPALLATGAVGGLDIGVGLLAMLIVREATGSEVVSALALSVGFVALTLGNSELFTENFLVPVASLVARRATVRGVVRLWLGTLVANLAGGWLVTALIIEAEPRLSGAAIEMADAYLSKGIGWSSFASALLGGMVITLMTWLQHSTSAITGKLVAAVALSFVLAAGPLSHSILGSLEIFAALRAGAPFGYADWLGFIAWSALGNAVGGIGLVTTLRLVQVGRDKITTEQTRAVRDEATTA
jgi:formate-nitrite transporter family protein